MSPVGLLRRHGAPWRRLHVRAALVVLPLLLLLGGVAYALLHHYSAQAALEASQRLNLGLARYIVEHQAPGLIGADGQPDRARMQDLAMHVMMINPMVEVYLLAADGRVLAHALDASQGPDPVGRRVDLAPLQRLLDDAGPQAARLPVFGTDPRHAQRRTTFSVARVSVGGAGAATPGARAARLDDGYLYVVLNGSTAQGVAATLDNSDALRAMALGLLAALALSVAVLWWALRTLTRPLRALTGELEAFRSEADADGAVAEPADEISLLRRAVRSMQRRLALQFKHLEDGDRQRRELVSNISHDLRTPLSSIQGYVETVLLRGDQLDEPARAAHLRTALRHVDLLGKRVADLFELSKLDAGRVTPRLEVFCLAELLQDVVQNHQLVAQRRGVRLALTAGSQTQARVRADIALIQRVLQNLIDNALRYTPEGGDVTLAIETRGSHLEVSVSDTGCGIADENLPHIFERYWRDSAADETSAATSSGLGLAIVKRIMDLHGSAVRVSSEFSRGTRFAFLLPQAA